MWGCISVLSVTLRNTIYSSVCNATTAARVHDHKVEMESDTERWRRLYECSDTIEQRMIPGGSNNERLTDADSIDTIHQSASLLPGSDDVVLLDSIMVNLRVQRQCNCYIHKAAQYHASRKALLHTMYALVIK